MKPHGHRRILLLAASVSLISHWLLLSGVDEEWLNREGVANDPKAPSVMMAQLQAAPLSTMPTRPQAPVAQTRPAASTASAAGGLTGQSSSREDASPASDEALEKSTPPPHQDQAPVAAVAAVQSGQQTFQVFLGDGEGDALAMVNHTLQVREGRYELSSRGEALGLLAMLYSGLLTQHSSGLLDTSGFSTQKYSEQRGKKPETRAEVDSSEAVVQFSHGGQATLKNQRVYDRLSVMYELALLVRAQPDLVRTPDLQVLSGQSLEIWRFVRVGSDEITTDGQRITAVHFRRQTTDGAERTGIDVWLDTAGNGWPVQIRLTDKKGTVITQRRQ